MSDRTTLYRDAHMYEADEGTGSMEQDAERRWVVPMQPDYEAGLHAARNIVAGKYLSVCRIKMIVDAALEIGDSDER